MGKVCFNPFHQILSEIMLSQLLRDPPINGKDIGTMVSRNEMANEVQQGILVGVRQKGHSEVIVEAGW